MKRNNIFKMDSWLQGIFINLLRVIEIFMVQLSFIFGHSVCKIIEYYFIIAVIIAGNILFI